MTVATPDIAWPLTRLGEAIEALGEAARLAPASRSLEVPSPPPGLTGLSDLARWLETAAASLSLEAERVSVPYADVEALVQSAAPALLRFTDARGESSFVALLRGGRTRVTILDTTRKPRQMSVAQLTSDLQQPLEAHLATEIAELDAMLARTVSVKRRARARAALMRGRFNVLQVSGAWLLRSPPGSSLLGLARRAGLPSLLAGMLVTHVGEYGLMLLSWWAVAQGALQGRFDAGWLAAWLFCLISIVPFQVLGARYGSRFSIAAGALLKTRMLAGALRLDPSEIRHQGAGQLLSRVIESSAVETLGVGGGLAGVVALVELVMCLAVLAEGSGGLVHSALLVAFIVVAGVAGAHYFGRRRRWTEVRLSMTHDLIERMVGHRTRLAQEAAERWHDGEDQALERYLVASRSLDRATILLSLVPRLWLIVGIAALVPQLLGAPQALSLAIAVGGILLGFRALGSLTSGVASIAGAAIAGAQARQLVDAARRPDIAPVPSVAGTAPAPDRDGSRSALLEARDLRFRFRERGEPVLRGCSLRVERGDRLLLEGPSGGGKSTFCALMAGLRPAESGLLLLDGLDRHTLGSAGWRRRVVAAPQFHENHVFGGTLAFNLLMGRSWPPGPGDLEEAEKVLRELDLGDLLDRMPAGMQQMVGETGWQLSHGEKSRLFIARVMLQDADLVLLDESFAALDPETMARALSCVRRRAKTLLVIAHP